MPTIPLSGRTLIAHLASYGLVWVLDDADIESRLHHDPDSQSFEPIVTWSGSEPVATAAVRASADGLEALVEADIEPGRRGNDRRPVIWARASFANDPERARLVQGLRGAFEEDVHAAGDRLGQALLAGLGAPATWGPETLKPSHGATALDGVLGNHTSDLVRGVLRPARAAAAGLDPDDRLPWTGSPDAGRDKTGWAPPGTTVDLVWQWLAALGLSLLPVGHQAMAASRTPAAWTRSQPRRHGVTLPLLDAPTSVARLRALLALEALTAIAGPIDAGDAAGQIAAAELRGMGVGEVVVFDRRYAAGSGSSVAFTYDRGQRIGLR